MNPSANRSQGPFRAPRVWSNEVLRTVAPLFPGEIVNVSGWDDRDKEGARYRDYFSRANRYYLTNYAGERGLADAAQNTDFEVDLSKPLANEYKERFDVVFNHTTLEHIFDVDLAFRNLCEMSRDIVIVVVPFAQMLHFKESSYGDYWRFTPMALRCLFEKNGYHSIFEAADTRVETSIYVVAVGSKNPERWQDSIPAWQPCRSHALGQWIGTKSSPRWIKFLKGMVRR